MTRMHTPENPPENDDELTAALNLLRALQEKPDMDLYCERHQEDPTLATMIFTDGATKRLVPLCDVCSVEDNEYIQSLRSFIDLSCGMSRASEVHITSFYGDRLENVEAALLIRFSAEPPKPPKKLAGWLIRHLQPDTGSTS